MHTASINYTHIASYTEIKLIITTCSSNWYNGTITIRELKGCVLLCLEYLCMCVHVCMWAHTHICLRMRKHISMYIWYCMWQYECECCLHIYVCMRLRHCMWMQISVCMCVYLFAYDTCVHVSMCALHTEHNWEIVCRIISMQIDKNFIIFNLKFFYYYCTY